MKCAMNYKPDDKFDLVHGLCRLFAEIDINGDRKMEWREFTQYVIDAVMQDNVKADSKGEMPNQKEMLEQAHSKKLLRFMESSCTDSTVHEGFIQRAAYYPSIDRVLLVESQSHLLKFVSPELRRREVIDLHDRETDLYASTDSLDEGAKAVQAKDSKYFVMAAAYDEKDQIVSVGFTIRPLIAGLRLQQSYAATVRLLLEEIQTCQGAADRRCPVRHLVPGTPQGLGDYKPSAGDARYPRPEICLSFQFCSCL